MLKRLVTVMPMLTGDQRREIEARARLHGYEVLFFPDPAAAMPALAEADIIFGSSVQLTRSAPALRWFCSSSAGIEPYLRPGAFASGAAVLTNSSGAYGITISEHIVMVILSMMRRQAEYSAITAARGWERNLPVRSLYASRITCLGTGDIGSMTARRLRGFEPAVIQGVSRSGAERPGFDRCFPLPELERLLPDTDVLILSLPSTPETRLLMNAERLALLPPDAYVVNVGRGQTLDQRALEAMLRAGRLAGAALDVFEREPIPLDDSLWTCPRLLITPHVAGDTSLTHTVALIVAQFLADFDRFCAGQPLLHAVNRQKGY